LARERGEALVRGFGDGGGEGGWKDRTGRDRLTVLEDLRVMIVGAFEELGLDWGGGG